jgi:hypothetical protein
MRKLFLLLAVLWGATSYAQVTVTGTVTDANSQAFANGTYQFTFATAAGNPGPYSFNGANFPVSTTYSGSLDASGAFSQAMAPNNQITPSGSQWILRFCPAADAPCYQTQLAINGAGSITSSLNPPAIQVQANLLNQPKAYTDAEITSPVVGFVYYNLTSGALRVCTVSVPCTWAALGGGMAVSTLGGSPSSAYTFFPATSSACTTYSATGTTFCAANNATGVVDFNGTDAGVVIRSAIANVSSRCGLLYFKNGVYNINSLAQESTGGFSNYFGIGIPGSAASGQYCQWILQGESAIQLVDQFGTGAQMTGALLNLTSTAESSVPANSKIMILWARPDVVNGVGASVFLRDISLRVPTNQRGCETQSDLSQTLNSSYDNVGVDTGVAESSIVFPVQASCVAWGSTDPGGLIGVTTTNSVKQESSLKRVVGIGQDVVLDIRGEHSTVEDSFGARCNHGIDYGVRGGNITHGSAWYDVGWGECARGLTLGSNIALGTSLDILSLDIEDASAGFAPTFAPVYHAIETNPYATSGHITYQANSHITNTVSNLPNLFDGGGGGNFLVGGPGSSTTVALPGIDTFTRPDNATYIGGLWSFAALSADTTLQIVSNSVRPKGTGAQTASASFSSKPFNSDQFGKVTIGLLDASASTFVEALTNSSGTGGTTNYYAYFCSNAAASGSGIVKAVANVNTTLVQQTSSGCAPGDTLELQHIGTWLYAYRNGALDSRLATNPISDSTLTTGSPGVRIAQDVTAGVSITFFQGGNFPTVHGSDSTYSAPETAPLYLTLGNCKAVGTAASPSVAACGSAAAGHFSCATNATGATCTINTTAVTATSTIIVQESDVTAVGTLLGVTCNTSTTVIPTSRFLASQTAGTGFTINLGTITTNPACFNYWIIN